MPNYDKDLVHIHANALQRIYNAFIDLDDKAFFLGIGNYIKYIDDNFEVFDPVIEKIKSLEKADGEKYQTLSTKVLEESKQTVEALIKLVNDQKIEDSKLATEIEEYRRYLDGSTRSTQRLEMSIYFCAVDILRVLEFLGKKDLVKDFLKLNSNGDVVEYKIAASYNDYILAEKDYKSKEKLGLWYVWDQLVEIYKAEYHHEATIKELHDKNDSLGLMFYATYKDDIDKITSGLPSRILNKDKLLYGVRSLHNFFVTEMEKLPFLSQDAEVENFAQLAQQTLLDLSFEVKKGILQNVVDKVVATQKEVLIYGYLPIEENIDVALCSIDRNRRPTKRWKVHTL